MKQISLRSTFETCIATFGMALALACALAPERAYAQTPPSGSYQQVCTRISFNQSTNVLSALCRTDDPNPNIVRSSSLFQPDKCHGDILDFDGDLACTKQLPLPGGSYVQACFEIWLDSGILHAHCRKIDGSRKKTRTAVPSPGDVLCDDIDGDLRCR
jgi:hypothetical protein